MWQYIKAVVELRLVVLLCEFLVQRRVDEPRDRVLVFVRQDIRVNSIGTKPSNVAICAKPLVGCRGFALADSFAEGRVEDFQVALAAEYVARQRQLRLSGDALDEAILDRPYNLPVPGPLPLAPSI
jgi:hypothetical protein